MPKTLLLADDSITIQKVVGITFANEDVELVTAPNGDDALRKTREIKPDLVMADIGMPGLDGYELCAAIRAEPAIAHIPVLLLTGTFETYDEQRANEVGASAYIAKPFEAQALIDQVYGLLERTALSPRPAALPTEEPGDTHVDAAPDVAIGNEPKDEATAHRAPEKPHELPNAEAPDLLAGSFSAPARPGEGQDKAASELTFEDIDLQEGQPEVGANTQIFGMGPEGAPDSTSPLGPEGAGDAEGLNPNETAVWSNDAGLPPAAAPELESAPPDRVEAKEPVAETVDTEQDIDPNETAFLDPLAAAPPPPDRETETTEPAEGATFSDWSRGSLDPPSDEGPDEDPELLPEAEPLDSGPPYEAPPPSKPTSGGPRPASGGPLPSIDRESVASAVEKVAWEAFGNLSEQLVREVVRKVEAIAWEVVPELAERLIQEEIDRLKRQQQD